MCVAYSWSRITIFYFVREGEEENVFGWKEEPLKKDPFGFYFAPYIF